MELTNHQETITHVNENIGNLCKWQEKLGVLVPLVCYSYTSMNAHEPVYSEPPLNWTPRHKKKLLGLEGARFQVFFV